jgi:hypothetical protein
LVGDRAGHQRETRRLEPVAVARHDRGRRERRDGRLADGDDVAFLADEAHEVDEVAGIILEREVAVLELHVPRVDPVGDVDLVVAEQRADSAAQQGREMAGHGRDQKNLRIVLAASFAEMEQLAERRPQHASLFDRDRRAVDVDAVDAIVGSRVREAGERHQLVIGAHPPPGRRRRMRGPGAEDHLRVLGQLTHAFADVRHPLIRVVHHKIARALRKVSKPHAMGLWHVLC